MTEVHIVSDGTGRDTYVTLPDGTKLDAVEATITIEANSVNKVDLTFVIPSLNIRGYVGQVTMICPACTGIFTHPCEPPHPVDEIVPDDAVYGD